MALTTPLPNRVRPVFKSTEKENLPPCFNMHAVKVVDSGNERPGAACSETLDSYMERKFGAMLDKKLKPLQDEVTKLKGQVHHIEGRLSESAALYNKQNEKIASQGKCIQDLQQRNQDLTYDRSAIDEIVANSAVAMCPLCNEERKSIICLPCAHTFCGECLKPSGLYLDDLFCPICMAAIHEKKLLR